MELQKGWFLFKSFGSVKVFRIHSGNIGKHSILMIWIQPNRFVISIWKFKFTMEIR